MLCRDVKRVLNIFCSFMSTLILTGLYRVFLKTSRMNAVMFFIVLLFYRHFVILKSFSIFIVLTFCHFRLSWLKNITRKYDNNTQKKYGMQHYRKNTDISLVIDTIRYIEKNDIKITDTIEAVYGVGEGSVRKNVCGFLKRSFVHWALHSNFSSIFLYAFQRYCRFRAPARHFFLPYL